MKKIILGALLTSCSIFAADTIYYMGVDYGVGRNDQKIKDASASSEINNDYSEVRIKAGSGNDGEVKFQLTASRSFYKNGLTNDQHPVYSLGWDVIDEFEIEPNTYVFFKLGIGVGETKTSVSENGFIRHFSYQGGIGGVYKVSNSLSAVLGLDYVSRDWKNVTLSDGSTLDIDDKAINPYLGLNYRF